MIAKLAQIIGFIGIAILIVATPWAFGGNVAKFQYWFFVVACCTLIPSLLLLIVDRTQAAAVRIPAVAFILIAALAVGFLQVVPLKLELLETLAPNAIELRSASAEAVGESLPDALPISLYANSTLNDLSLLVLPIAVFLVASTALRERTAQIGILGIAAANGAAFAIFGLIQQLTFNDKLYWSVPLRFGGKPFAAFVNRNHAGGYLNMCIAAAIALTYYALTRKQVEYNAGPADYAQPYAFGGALRGGFNGFLANLDGTVLMAIALTGCAITGTISSGSRGALLALVCAAAFTALASVRARGGVGLAVGGVALLSVCIGMAMWLGNTELLSERWGDTVNQLQGRSNSRIDHWQDVTRVCRDYWMTGTGLGTYRYAYRPYETQLGIGWFMHAENQYLEALVEMGWLGLVFILLAISLVLAGALRLMHTRGDTLGFGIGLAGIFMICSQAVHAGFDFGLYMPANAILCAAMAGIATAKTPVRTSDEAQWARSPSLLRRGVEASILLIVAGCLVWGTLQTTRKAAIAAAFEGAYELDVESPHDLTAIDNSIAAFQSAIEAQPDDAEALFRIAELYIQRYRELAFAELRQATQSDDRLLWDLTQPISFHARTHQLKVQSADELNDFVSQPLIQQELIPAMERLLAARRSCPLLHKVHFRIAELFGVAPAVDEIKLVETAVHLGPNNSNILLRAGLLDWHAGRKPQARAEWQRSLSVSPVHAEKIFEFVANQDPDDAETTAAAITPLEPEKIIKVARQLKNISFRILLADKAEQAISLAQTTPGNRNHLLGSILELRGQLEDAVSLYDDACDENPNRLEWRYDLAKLLMKLGRFDEASQQAATCLRKDPGSPVYRQLLKSIRAAKAFADAARDKK